MYTIENIANILNARCRLKKTDAEIAQLLTDSRRIIFPETSLFFPIITQRRDGHIFIPEVYERGVRNFVVQTGFDTASLPEGNFIFVDDTFHALQKLAAHHRSHPGRGGLDLAPLGLGRPARSLSLGAGTALTGQPIIAQGNCSSGRVSHRPECQGMPMSRRQAPPSRDKATISPSR